MKFKVITLSVIIIGCTVIANPANGSANYSYASYFDWQGARLASDSAMSQIITPLAISPSTYWEEGWHWSNGSNGGYGGIQDQGNLANGKISDLAIFSLWDAVQGIPGEADAGCLPFGGEGAGYSCRVPITLIATHSYRLTFEVNTNLGPDWWKASIEDLNAGITKTIGSIQANQQNLYANNWNNFIEYWGQDIPCETLGLATAMFGNPFSNNPNVKVKFWKFTKPTNLCGYTSADTPANGEIGNPVMHFGGAIQLADTILGQPLATPTPTPTPTPNNKLIMKSWICKKNRVKLKFKGTKLICPLDYKIVR